MVEELSADNLFSHSKGPYGWRAPLEDQPDRLVAFVDNGHRGEALRSEDISAVALSRRGPGRFDRGCKRLWILEWRRCTLLLPD